MEADRSIEELSLRATEALEALAMATGARGHIWMVIKGDGDKIGGCSPSLRPYGAALMDEVDKAVEKPVNVTSVRDPSVLLKAEVVLHKLAKTKHVELHPIVANLVQGLNEINDHKHPRVNALQDPSTVPKWFPFPPEVYAPRAQKMDLHQLFHVMDVIFGEIRGNLDAIQTLHQKLNSVYKGGSCSIGTRAGIDSFFGFLEAEAMARKGGAVKQEVLERADTPPVADKSETNSVGREDEEESEERSRKRNRNADVPRSSKDLSPANSTANRTPVEPVVEEEIDFEKYMSGQGEFLAEFDALTRPPANPAPFFDPASVLGSPDLSEAFEANVHFDESAVDPPSWNFSPAAPMHSGGSTLATGSDPMLTSAGAFQVASGEMAASPTSGNWTPEWFPEQPMLQPNEAVVLARLHQQMARDGVATGPPPAAGLTRDDMLSESMRWDFQQQRGAPAPRGEEQSVEVVLRNAGLLMARAPSFPAQSVNARTNQVTPPQGPPKPANFLQKAKVLILPRSPRNGKAKGGAAEPFPQFRGVVDPPEDTRSGELPARRAFGERGRQPSGGGSSQSSGDQQFLAGDCLGEHSGKAIKILGLEDSGSFSSSQSVPETALDESGSVDEEDLGSKKGLARFLKLGRNKARPTNRSPKGENAQPAVLSQRSGELLAPVGGMDRGLVLGGGADPESCEAFPFVREVERFDSFASEQSAHEAESEDCERFPFKRSEATSETGVLKISVSEGFHTEPKRSHSPSGNASLPDFLGGPMGASTRAARQSKEDLMKSMLGNGSQKGTSSPKGATDYMDDDTPPLSPAFALGIADDDQEVDDDEEIPTVQGVHLDLSDMPQLASVWIPSGDGMGSGAFKPPPLKIASTMMHPMNGLQTVEPALAGHSPQAEGRGDLVRELRKLRV